MRIPQNFIDDVLAKTDLAQLIENSGVSLKRAGPDKMTACCPFHKEKTPSFQISHQHQSFKCWGCGESGGAIDYLMKTRNMPFPEVVKELAHSAGLQMPKDDLPKMSEQEIKEKKRKVVMYRALEEANKAYQTILEGSPVASDYLLKERSLPASAIKSFSIGFTPDDWHFTHNILKAEFRPTILRDAGLLKEREGNKGFYDLFRNRIMFPIRNLKGSVVGFGGRVMGDEKPKYINPPETPLFKKSNLLYGLYECLQQKQRDRTLRVVEGYLDVIGPHEAGLKDHCATCGTALTEGHAQLLFRYADQITLVFDGDKAGRKAAWSATETMLPLLGAEKRVNIVLLPEGQDPYSLIIEEGVEAYEERLKKATPLSIYFFNELAGRLNPRLPENRAEGINRAQDLIKTIKDESLRGIMLLELQNRFKLGDPTKQVAGSSKMYLSQLGDHIKKTLRNSSLPVRQLCAVLASNPPFVGVLPDQLTKMVLAGDSLDCFSREDQELLKFIVTVSNKALEHGTEHLEDVLSSEHRYLVLYLKEKAKEIKPNEQARCIGKVLTESIPYTCNAIEVNHVHQEDSPAHH